MRKYELTPHDYLYLLNLYPNIREPTSYGSLQDVWMGILRQGNPRNLKKKHVQVFLQNLDVYTLHKGIKKSFVTSHIYTRHINTNLHFDYFLIDIDGLESEKGIAVYSYTSFMEG